MSHRRTAVVPFLAAVILLSLTAAPPAQDAPFAAVVDEVVQKHLKNPRAVGLSVGVLWQGKLHGKGYGRAEAEFDSPADAETMFRIGSITKQFTSALVMRLVEQGKVALADPLSKHVPQFATGERTVTVEQLLNHTSGIKSYTDLGEPWRKVWPLELSHAELLALVADKPFDFEPGEGWHYNNTGYYLLGMLLENVHGKPYAEVLAAELCGPLGLQRTRYDSNRDLIRNRAQGYDFNAGKLHNDAALGMAQPGGAGGMLSTGADLVRWGQALAGGKVVSADSFARMTTSTVVKGRNTRYGFGLMLDELAGKRRIGHGGGIHGFNSMLFWLPEADCFVAVIANCQVDSNRVAEEIALAVLGLERTKAEDKATTPELRAALAGSYHFDDMQLDIEVRERDGKLYAQGKGQQEFQLLWQGGLEFRAGFDHDVKLVWAEDKNSFVLHQRGEAVAKRKT